jgi:hypothetical protein
MSLTVWSAVAGSRNWVVAGAFSAVPMMTIGRSSRVAPVSARCMAAWRVSHSAAEVQPLSTTSTSGPLPRATGVGS